MARAKLGEILIQQGVIDASALKLALGAQIRFASQRMKIGQVLVDMGACTTEHVARALGAQIGVPYTDLSTAQPAALGLLPTELCTKHHAIAIAIEVGPPEMVHVAFAEPLDLGAVDAVRSRLAKRVKAYIASPEAIAAKLAARDGHGLELAVAPSEGVELGDVLFGDEGGGTLAIEHEEPGQVRVAGLVSMGGDERSMDFESGPTDDLFGRGGTPVPVASIIQETTPALAAAPAPAADFDSLFGPDPGVGVPVADAELPLAPLADDPSAPVLEGTVSPVLEGTVSALAEDAIPEPEVDTSPPPPPVPIHHFVDRRPPKAARPPPPPPSGSPPPLPPPPPLASELSSEALFGDEPVAADPAPAPLMGAEFAAVPTTEVAAEPPGVEPEAGLFGAPAAHVGEHDTHDSAPPAEAAHRDLLFGDVSGHLSEQHSGDGLEVAAEAPPISAELTATEDAVASSLAAEWDQPEPTSSPQAAPVPEEHLDLDFSEVEPEASAPISTAALTPDPLASTLTLEAAPTVSLLAAPPPLPPRATSSASAVVLKAPERLPQQVPLAESVAAPAFGDSPRAVPEAAAAPPSEPVPPPQALVPETPVEPKSVEVAIATPELDSLASFADRPLTDAELEVITAIERLADGASADEATVKQVKPAQMVAALVRLLIRQGIIQETDFLSELSRK